MSALNADRLRTLGGIVSAWCLLDEQSSDGKLDGYTPEILDELVGLQGLSRAMEAAGWLIITEKGLEAPEFEKHNGATAKRRAQENDRKTSARNADKNPQPKQTNCGPEKRREEKNKIPPTPKGDGDVFAGMSEARKATFQEWMQYKAEKRQGYKPTGLKALIKEHASMTDQQLATAVQHSMSKNYNGIFAPNAPANQPALPGLTSRPLN